MSRHCRVPSARLLATVMLLLSVGGCSAWHLTPATPAELFGEDPPSRVRLTTVDEAQFVLRDPEIAGDSIVGRTRGRDGSNLRVARSLGDVLKLEVMASAPSAVALTTDSLWIGSRVRLGMPDGVSLVGEVRGLSEGGLILLDTSGQRASVEWRLLSDLEVSRARRGHGAVGALLGLAVGVAVAGYTAWGTEYEDPSSGTVFALGLTAVGLPAMGLGALIGSGIRSDPWRRIPIPPPHRGP